MRARLAAAAIVLALSVSCSSGPDPRLEEAIRENNLGTALLSQQRWADAETRFARARDLRPEDSIPLVNLAIALLQQGKAEEAETLLRSALALRPEDLHARFQLGLVERSRGRFEEAASHFGAVASADPGEVFAQHALGATLARIGRAEEAERAFRRAIERNPMHVSSLYALGRLLVQEGRDEEGRVLIERSQAIRAQGFDETVGTQYGEQGPYAMGVDYPADALPVPAPNPVSLARARTLPRPSLDAFAPHVPSRGDAPVLLFASGDAIESFGTAGSSRIASTGGRVLALASGDLDRDGEAEIVTLLASGEIPGIGRVGDGPVASGALALLDADHDGDLDLFVCWVPGAPGCALATNDGSGRLTLDPADRGLSVPAGATGPVAVAFSDLDDDRDLDLLAASAEGVRFFSNLRDGTYRDLSEASGLGAKIGGVLSLAVADVDKDGLVDLVLGTTAGARVLRNARGVFEPLADLGGPSGIALLLDFDNDGFVDVAGSGAEIRLHRNVGGGRFEPPARAVKASASAVLDPVAAFDADGDGDVDLFARGSEGLSFLRNDGGNAHRSLSIRLEGVRDNPFGVGAKVEVLAGALRQKLEATSSLPVHVGLGGREGADAVRVLWPGGVLQDEIGIGAGRVEVVQLDRKGTSCPLLYARRGGAWRFVTDFLGGCAIGYQVAPGIFSVPDTDEVVKIEGGLDEEDGLLRLRLHNQLEEVIWFDHAALLVVDHPEGTEVFPNERLMPGPPFPDFRLFASNDLRPVAGARVPEEDRDVTDLLLARDRRYVEGFGLLPFKGYADAHSLEIDLGPLPLRGRVVLLLDGWIDYADSTANVAAAHAGAKLVPPRLFAEAGGGRWLEVEGRMGFPAGLPKTMAVDLTGALAPGRPRIRIETTMRIYWDRARVLVGGEATPLEVRRLAARSAELFFGGFPEETSPDGRKPFGYDPARVLRDGGWKAHRGAYTAFGDVTGRLRAIDDRFVTTRNGDAIDLAFDPPPPPRRGWTRSFFLYADGFGKDMDPNSAASETVAPIPFHGMPRYPYGPEIVPPVVEEEGTPVRRVRGERPLPTADLRILGGEVIDGTGSPARRADVAVRDGRVVAIGNLASLPAEKTIDATGLVVAPGFVDMHSHADLILLGDRATQERLLAAKIGQGVTTLVVGNCGLGVAPASEEAASILAGVNAWMTPEGIEAGPLTTAEYLDRLEANGVALHVAALVPHGPVRISAMGLREGAADAAALSRMRREVARALDEGAFGLSTGLIYPPGMYSPTGELVALADEVARRDRLFTSHVRGSSETLLPATDELIEIARLSGARVHHSHLEAVGRRFWPDVSRVLEREDAARLEGLRVSHDMFPYTRAATMMAAVFPPWALEGGVPALLDRLRDRATRERIAREIDTRVPEWPPWREGGWPHNLVGAVGWDGILVASVASRERAGAIGKSLEALASHEGRAPFDLLADLMLEEEGRVGQLVAEISGDDGDERALRSILRHPAGAVVSDAEDYGRGLSHPAHAGAFARALAIARETGEIPLEEAIRKMTSFPASIVGLDGVGTIRVGGRADLVLFDPRTVADRATWLDPGQTAIGVRFVLLDGAPVVEEGRYLGGLPGRVIRARPSRPVE